MSDVSFYEQFELLEMLRDDGVKSFRAKELSTGRDVEAHIFVNPQAPLSVALLSRLNKLPAADRDRIVHRGKNQGTPYVVTTPFSDYAGLREWLSAKRPTANGTEPHGPVESASPARVYTRVSLQPANRAPEVRANDARSSEARSKDGPASGEFSRLALIKSGIIPEGVIGSASATAVAEPPASVTRQNGLPPLEEIVVEAVLAPSPIPEPVQAIEEPPIVRPVERTATVPIAPSVPGWPPPPVQASQVAQQPQVWIAPLAAPAPPPPVFDWKTQAPQYISLLLSSLALVLVLLMFFTRP